MVSLLLPMDLILVTTSNAVAFVFEFIGVLVFLIYNDFNKIRKRMVNLCLIFEAAVTVFIYAVTLWFFQLLSTRHNFVGVSCNFCTIFIYFFLTGQTMAGDKSFRDMQFWLSFVSFINAGIWIAFSLIYIMDIHLLISYGFGTFFCALQILYACYDYCTTRGPEPVHHVNDDVT